MPKRERGTFAAVAWEGPLPTHYVDAFVWHGHRFVVHRPLLTGRGYRVSHEASGLGTGTWPENTIDRAKKAAIAKLESNPRYTMRKIRKAMARKVKHAEDETA